ETTKPPAYPFIIINVKEQRRQKTTVSPDNQRSRPHHLPDFRNLKAAPPPLNPVTVAVPLR
ncbi:hypothetical protein, partial [Cereibacter sediminicola]|uniref:hypothetical protein n=1 Tax=Cereibacter sediminicola TaxID=2584941 RepID=UPI001C92D6BD